eukprot:2575199-Pyramimonas_sp.AAC.1
MTILMLIYGCDFEQGEEGGPVSKSEFDRMRGRRKRRRNEDVNHGVSGGRFQKVSESRSEQIEVECSLRSRHRRRGKSRET